MNNKTKKFSNEHGGVFFYILIAVVLLAALTYHVSRSNRSNTSTITEQQARVLSQEILEQVQLVRNAAQKLILRGFDPTEVSFENNTEANYVLSTCPNDDCKIFSIGGGSLNWIEPPTNSSNGNDWVYTGVASILDNGSDSRSDITMVLPNISESVCRNLNLQLGITADLNDAIPTTDDTSITIQKLNDANVISDSANVFDGTNITGNEAVCVEVGAMSGEFSGNNLYHFVATIYAG